LDVTGAASASGVNGGATRWVAGDGVGRNFTQGAHKRGEVRNVVISQEPAFGHIRRNAAGDDGLEGGVIGRVREFDAIERWAAAAFALDAVADGAVAFEEALAGLGIGGWSVFRRGRLGGPGGGEEAGGEHAC
jgi:hypothetical protein